MKVGGACNKIFEYHGTVSGHLVLSETAALIVTPLSMRALTETALAFKYFYSSLHTDIAFKAI